MIKQDQNTDKDLMIKLKNGDLSALDVVYKKYAKQVYLVFLRKHLLSSQTQDNTLDFPLDF